MKNLTGHRNQIHSLIELPNNDLASGSVDTTIKIWDWKRDDPLKHSFENLDCSHSLAVLRNGDLATIFNKTFIKIWS